MWGEPVSGWWFAAEIWVEVMLDALLEWLECNGKDLTRRYSDTLVERANSCSPRRPLREEDRTPRRVTSTLPNPAGELQGKVGMSIPKMQRNTRPWCKIGSRNRCGKWRSGEAARGGRARFGFGGLALTRNLVLESGELRWACLPRLWRLFIRIEEAYSGGSQTNDRSSENDRERALTLILPPAQPPSSSLPRRRTSLPLRG